MNRAIAISLALVVAAAILAIMFAGPVVRYWQQRTADAEAGQEAAIDNSTARGLEAEGTQVLADQASAETAAVEEIRERTYVIERERLADPDSATPLPSGALDRLRAGDRLLCDSGVECRSGSAAAAPGAPGDGGGAL